MSPAMRPSARGFTLLEVLVAVAIFAVIGVLAMSGYNELIGQSRHVELTAARIQAVQSAVMRMSQDFAQLEPRPIREPLGDTNEPALRADRRTDTLVEFTRAGWSNPAGTPRATLQRVAYRVQDGRLLREYWVVLDRTMGVGPVRAELLDGVERVRLRFMDANRAWHEQWPPAPSVGRDAQRLRPIAVEFTLELEDWGEIVRLVETPG